MKTTTMLLIGLAGVGAYLAYKASAPKQMTVTGSLGVSKTFPVDSNMTADEIAQTSQQWNRAFAVDDTATCQNIIGTMSGKNHPMAAAALVGVLNEALNRPIGATAGYSAGAIRPIRMLPSLGRPIEQAHRLAMLGRI
jgi:hypothetical protein